MIIKGSGTKESPWQLKTAPGTSALVGSMSGFFQLDAHGNFAFAWPPTYVTFDTQAPGSIPGTQNVMTVGPPGNTQTYT